MMAFIDAHRDVYGVESICRILPIAPSTYDRRARRRHDPERWPARARIAASGDAVSVGMPSRRATGYRRKAHAGYSLESRSDVDGFLLHATVDGRVNGWGRAATVRPEQLRRRYRPQPTRSCRRSTAASSRAPRSASSHARRARRDSRGNPDAHRGSATSDRAARSWSVSP